MTTINAIGRIVRDFELRKSEKSGCIYANFSLVVNEGYGDKKKETYFECTVFGADAERLVKAKAKKGSLIQVTGKFGTSEFTRTNGEPGYSLKITVLAWSYIPGSNGQKDATNGNSSNADNGGTAQTPATAEATNQEVNATTNLDDEDLPL
jgi:single-strand DNA-binding protein